MINTKLQKVCMAEFGTVKMLKQNIGMIAEQRGASAARIVKMIKERKRSLSIPISIFSNECSPLENLVYYLAKTEGLSQKEIGMLLKRDSTTIWTTLMNAEKKKPEQAQNGLLIPVSQFSDRTFSILESLASYIYRQGSSLHQIAVMLGKDDRTIWTVVDRAKRKSVHDITE